MTFKRDKELLEEELANGPRAERPRSLATHYLSEACDALHQAGDPEFLYRNFRPDKIQPKPFGWEWMRRWAREERFTQTVNCVLFCAFAAEAYVNEFLASFAASNSEFKRLDHKYGTPDKYLKGVEDVFGEPLFRETGDPDDVIPTLRKLFSLRNDLAHPKPGLGPAGLSGESDPELDARLALPELANFLIIVAGAGDSLTMRAYGFEYFDLHTRSIWRARKVVREFAERCAEIPAPDAAAEPRLQFAISDYLMQQPPAPDHPDASWTRLRKAREAREAHEES